MMNEQKKVTGVVLAGGQASRMHYQDKGLLLFKQRPLVAYALAALAPLSAELLISANRHITEYAALGVPVIGDATPNFDGPLAGILAAMQIARQPILLVAPCDSPLVETRHLQQLLTGLRAEYDVCVAATGERLHPVFMAVRVDLQADLQAFLAAGERKMQYWLRQQRWSTVDFSTDEQLFKNINNPADLMALQN